MTHAIARRTFLQGVSAAALAAVAIPAAVEAIKYTIPSRFAVIHKSTVELRVNGARVGRMYNVANYYRSGDTLNVACDVAPIGGDYTVVVSNTPINIYEPLT